MRFLQNNISTKSCKKSVSTLAIIAVISTTTAPLFAGDGIPDYDSRSEAQEALRRQGAKIWTFDDHDVYELNGERHVIESTNREDCETLFCNGPKKKETAPQKAKPPKKNTDRGNSSNSDLSDKIVCTAMNAAYGFGSYRQAIWLAHAAQNLTRYHQTGYHMMALPLIRVAYGSDQRSARVLRAALEHMARERTADIRAEMRGVRRRTLGRLYRAILEPLSYGLGWLAGGRDIEGIEAVPVLARQIKAPVRRKNIKISTLSRLKTIQKEPCKMLNILKITALSALLVATGSIATAEDTSSNGTEWKYPGSDYQHWHVKKRWNATRVASNLTKEDMAELLNGSTFVSRHGSEKGAKTDTINIIHFATTGKYYHCDIRADGFHWTDNWTTVDVNSSFAKVMRPAGYIYSDGEKYTPYGGSFSTYRYDGETGALADLAYYKDYGRRFWEYLVGHLQKGIPAITYESCPDFPTGKALGTFINKKQTSKLYHELIKQDPGQRIIRPDLITENTARPFDPWKPHLIFEGN